MQHTPPTALQKRDRLYNRNDTPQRAVLCGDELDFLEGNVLFRAGVGSLPTLGDDEIHAVCGYF